MCFVLLLVCFALFCFRVLSVFVVYVVCVVSCWCFVLVFYLLFLVADGVVP